MSAITLPAIAEAMQVSSLSVTWVANSYILGLTLIIPLSPVWRPVSGSAN